MDKQEIKKVTDKERYNLSDLRTIFTYLRGENGCPWDRVQTHESIRANLIEETYEVVEAIDTVDSKLMREELGDLLLQVVFHAALEEEEGRFTLDDVISDIAAKLVRRHPHVFGDENADDPERAIDAWEKAKGVEKKDRRTIIDSMNAIPPSLPSLMRAQKIVKKASKVGYDIHETVRAGAKKIKALADLMETSDMSDAPNLLAESLFTISAFATVNGIDTEELLSKKSTEFIKSYK